MRIKRIMNGPRPVFKHVSHKIGLMATAFGLTFLFASAVSSAADAKQAPTPQVKANATETYQPAAQAPVQTIQNKFKIDGTLSSSYGPADDPFKKGARRNHHGVDFKAPMGTPIYAPADGLIIEATENFKRGPAYGTVVIFQTEGGVQTMMAHLKNYAVQKGMPVVKGQKIAEIGSTGKSTGPHVHIETRLNGSRVDPASVWHFAK